MGRYNRIRVYHNGSWVQPTSCSVYHAGGWWYLGPNDASSSYNSKNAYVEYNNNYLRTTLQRQDYSYVTDSWAQGAFSLLPAGQYNYCSRTTASGVYNQQFYFAANIEKTEDVDQILFFNGKPSYSFISIVWLADGRIRIQARYGTGTTYTAYTSNSVGKNIQTSFWIRFDAGTRTGVGAFNGVSQSMTVATAFAYAGSGAYTQVGDTYTRFRTDLAVIGGGGSNNSTVNSVQFNPSTASGSDGYRYSGVNHQESRSSGTNWI
jgi:hypothetical protein